MTEHKVVIWGAGRIGRGFVADLFDSAGYRITFVDQSPELVGALRQAGRFTVVRAADAHHRHDRIIEGYFALTIAQTEEIATAVAEADSLVVAVFPEVFPEVARQLVPGIFRRAKQHSERHLDIILCTNLSHAGMEFQKHLTEALPPELQDYASHKIGIVESLVIRMVAEPPAELKQQEPLLVWTNGFPELPVDRLGFKGPVPSVAAIRLVDQMHAEETRKLFTYNMCHVVLAYHGALRGHTLSVECLHDPEIHREAVGALAEASQALQIEFGYGAEEMAAWNENVLRQTDNPTLQDSVERHGKDPRRKLKRADRLVGPTLLARKHGVSPLHLTRAIAAALLYQNAMDPGATYVKERVSTLGPERAAVALCQLSSDEIDVAEMIAEQYAELAAAFGK